MDDKFLEMLDESSIGSMERIRHMNAFGNLTEGKANYAGRGMGGKFVGGKMGLISALSEGAKAALDMLASKMKPVKAQVNWGNCPDGYNLEAASEDEDYVLVICSGGNHWLILAKKTHKHEASNGGFMKDNTVAEIIGENKYAR